jgi:hypothetical protein
MCSVVNIEHEFSRSVKQSPGQSSQASLSERKSRRSMLSVPPESTWRIRLFRVFHDAGAWKTKRHTWMRLELAIAPVQSHINFSEFSLSI